MQKLYGMQFALGQNLVSTNAIFGYQLNGTILKCKNISFDAIYIHVYIMYNEVVRTFDII